MVDISVVFFCVIFSIGFAQLNVVKRKFITAKDRRIIPTSTTVIHQMTPSPAVCASFCSIEEICCCASYDTKTMQCKLDESCSPESEISADALMLTKSKDQLSCQNGWFRNENKCYYFSEEKSIWKEAEIACQLAGGMLVEIDSKGENDYLKMKISAQWYWLGGTDAQNENVWIWSQSQNNFTLEDWDEGQPDNINDNEHCVALWHNSKIAWHDAPCEWSIRFICEKDF